MIFVWRAIRVHLTLIPATKTRAQRDKPELRLDESMHMLLPGGAGIVA